MAKSKKTKCYIYTKVSTAMQVDGYSLVELSRCATVLADRRAAA